MSDTKRPYGVVAEVARELERRAMPGGMSKPDEMGRWLLSLAARLTESGEGCVCVGCDKPARIVACRECAERYVGQSRADDKGEIADARGPAEVWVPLGADGHVSYPVGYPDKAEAERVASTMGCRRVLHLPLCIRTDKPAPQKRAETCTCGTWGTTPDGGDATCAACDKAQDVAEAEAPERREAWLKLATNWDMASSESRYEYVFQYLKAVEQELGGSGET